MNATVPTHGLLRCHPPTIRDVVSRLLRVVAELAGTITAPLDGRRPGNDEDRIRVRNQLSDARIQVLATSDAGRAGTLLNRLDAALPDVEWDAGAQGA